MCVGGPLLFQFIEMWSERINERWTSRQWRRRWRPQRIVIVTLLLHGIFTFVSNWRIFCAPAALALIWPQNASREQTEWFNQFERHAITMETALLKGFVHRWWKSVNFHGKLWAVVCLQFAAGFNNNSTFFINVGELAVRGTKLCEQQQPAETTFIPRMQKSSENDVNAPLPSSLAPRSIVPTIVSHCARCMNLWGTTTYRIARSIVACRKPSQRFYRSPNMLSLLFRRAHEHGGTRVCVCASVSAACDGYFYTGTHTPRSFPTKHDTSFAHEQKCSQKFMDAGRDPDSRFVLSSPFSDENTLLCICKVSRVGVGVCVWGYACVPSSTNERRRCGTDNTTCDFQVPH